MELKVPNLSPEDREQFKTIFSKVSEYCQKEIDDINKRSFWKRMWNPMDAERIYLHTVKSTVEVLKGLFDENIKTVKIDETD